MVDRDLRFLQIAEQLVPTVLSFASLQQQTVEHIVNIPVPPGRGDHGGLHGLHQGQNTAAVVEQSVDIPVSAGGGPQLRDLGGSRSSAVSREEAGHGFFSHFPRFQKRAEVAGQVGQNLPGHETSGYRS